MTYPTSSSPLSSGLARAALVAAIAFQTAACSGFSKIDVFRVITSGRDGHQHPERVIEALALREGDVVAEIGGGKGYWMPWLSAAVGETGHVYMVEVEDGLVEILEQKASELGLRNVTAVRGAFEDPKLPDGKIDLALTCNTYHHIEDREAYFAKLRVDLSARGRVAHLDGVPDAPWFVKLASSSGHWSDVNEMNDEMQTAGYRRTETFDFLVQSFQVFEPGREGAE